MQRSESVPRLAPPPAPFRHPHWESPRERDARLFRREIREYVAVADALRARIAAARVLETVQ